MTILQKIKCFAKKTPDTLAVVDVELTYEQYWEKICGVAEYLRKRPKT